MRIIILISVIIHDHNIYIYNIVIFISNDKVMIQWLMDHSWSIQPGSGSDPSGSSGPRGLVAGARKGWETHGDPGCKSDVEPSKTAALTLKTSENSGKLSKLRFCARQTNGKMVDFILQKWRFSSLKFQMKAWNNWGLQHDLEYFKHEKLWDVGLSFFLDQDVCVKQFPKLLGHNRFVLEDPTA